MGTVCVSAAVLAKCPSGTTLGEPFPAARTLKVSIAAPVTRGLHRSQNMSYLWIFTVPTVTAKYAARCARGWLWQDWQPPTS